MVGLDRLVLSSNPVDNGHAQHANHAAGPVKFERRRAGWRTSAECNLSITSFLASLGTAVLIKGSKDGM
jgi:hypothetical protein